MKNITIGFVTICALLPSIVFGAANTAAKKEVTIPCYNGGFNFGLAGYSQPVDVINNQQPPYTPSETEPSWDTVQPDSI